MDSELISLLLIGFLLIIIFVVIIIIARKRKFGFQSTVLFGTTHEFYDKDKKAAIEIMVEQKAGKKMEEQSSAEPESRKNKSQSAATDQNTNKSQLTNSKPTSADHQATTRD